MKITVEYNSTEARFAKKVSVYVRGIVSKKHRVHQLRDEIADNPGIPTKEYTKLPAHLTVLPEMETTSSNVQKIQAAVREKFGKDVLSLSINGAGVWPNFRNPRVILLDAVSDWQKEQQVIYNKLHSESEITFSYPPTKPHLTLLKKNTETVGKLTKAEQKRLQTWIKTHRQSWEAKLEGIQIEVKKTS